MLTLASGRRNRKMARQLGVPPSTVLAWQRRNGIPVKYWRELIRVAHENGHTWLTIDLLVDAHGDPERAAA